MNDSKLDEILFKEKQLRPWLMWEADRFVLIALLEAIRPKVAIEIGTAHGGSTAVLCRYSQTVYSLDLDPRYASELRQSFPNVTFVTGSSQETLPDLLKQLNDKHAEIGFILIDGDHSYGGVLVDIESILRYRPVCPTYVLMHDSFHPTCRRAMRDASWSACQYVHSVELDLSVGHFDLDPAYWRHMWGGFALAIMRPEVREGDLQVRARHEPQYRIIRWHSANWNPIWYSLGKLRRMLRKIVRPATEG